MCNILYICTLVWLTFGPVYGNQCVQKNEKPMGCPIFKTEPQNGCQTYLETNEEIRNVVFYMKPLNTGQLAISLHQRSSGSSSSQITPNLFSTTIKVANVWYKVNIKRDKGRKTGFFGNTVNINTYTMEVNDQQKITHPNDIKAGNEIRMKTVTSLWSLECDPRQYKPHPQPAAAASRPQPTHPSPQQLSPDTTSDTNITYPTISEDLLPPQILVKTTEEEDKGFLESITEHIPLWQLITIGSVSLVLILIIIIVTVVLVFRHKKKKCDSNLIQLIQPTNHQSRLSRHVSENSLYESYDNQVVGPAAGTGWGSHDTSQDHVYEEIHPQGISVSNSAISSATTKRRGSAHVSENSLYMGFS